MLGASCAEDAAIGESSLAKEFRSPSLTEPVTYEVDFSAVVTAPYHTKVLKVWMPIPQSDGIQQISDSELTTFPERVVPQISSEPVYGNRFAYFEFHEPQGGQIIRHHFTATVRNARWELDPSLVQTPDTWPQKFAPYLTPDSIAEVSGFQDVIRTISPDRPDRTGRLFAAMDWIDEHMTYDHVDASLRADARHAFEKRHGHCSDYHGLCATMGRSLGFPTRVTYGIALFPKNSPSHCKLEAFLPPYGWVSFDLSETQKMIAAIEKDLSLDVAKREKLKIAARERLMAGFRENSWLLLTRGTDYELSPRASRAVRVVRTIYAEADGEPLPDPDPANSEKREFGWMTVHAYKSDRPVPLPFKDFDSLAIE
ncbi:MAG: transglutaminase domain-containing protein [Planctomycetaceae bacterium]|nr:transglutaminase domain-containing protein [Planctomycetales bacterium]MCB9925963.1 transglutaminase domain-containing protein [Planctomycetaceae bacterium]